MEKYMQNVSKFDKGLVIAMTEHVLYQKASTENQGRAIDNFFSVHRYKDARFD